MGLFHQENVAKKLFSPVILEVSWEVFVVLIQNLSYLLQSLQRKLLFLQNVGQKVEKGLFGDMFFPLEDLLHTNKVVLDVYVEYYLVVAKKEQISNQKGHTAQNFALIWAK